VTRSPPNSSSRVLGGAFTLLAIAFQVVWLGLPAIFLGVALVASYALWLEGSWSVSPGLRRWFLIGIFVFVAHVIEEYSTGFPEALPGLFGRDAWSGAQYFVFVGVWGLLFVGSALSLGSPTRLPVLVLIFFAIGGGVGNGLLHLIMVLVRGAYFPGAWTALPCLVVGVILLRLLYPRSAGIEP
jgi:Protein of unknown function with HXXEE motif